MAYAKLIGILLLSLHVFPGPAFASGGAEDFGGEIVNAVDLEEGLVGGGLISEKAVAIAAAKGYRTVIDLRTSQEGILPEKTFVEKNGLRYINLSTAHGSLAQAEELRAVLSQPDIKPAILHCRSGRRVRAVWSEYQKLDAI